MTRRGFLALGFLRPAQDTPARVASVYSVTLADGGTKASYFLLRDQDDPQANGSAFMAGGDHDVPAVALLRARASYGQTVRLTLE